MKTIPVKICLVIFIILSVDGCATIFKGYEDEVTLTRMPEDIKVYSEGNVEIPILKKIASEKWTVSGRGEFDSVTAVKKYILLRSNQDHILVFKNPEQEKRFHVYPRLSAGWFILGCVTGTFFVDLYTGNWNHFNDIDFENGK